MKPSPSIFAYETQVSRPLPSCIEVRGAHVHNLKDVDIDIPLNSMVGIAGISGSGKAPSRLACCTRRDHDCLSGSAIDLYKKTYDPGKPRNRRRGASYSGGIGTASASISAWSPFHVRHNERTAQQSAPPVLPDRIARVRTLRSTQPTHDERCRRASDALHVLRRTHASAISGGSRIQRRGRVSDMLRHRNHEGSRPFRLGTG